MIVTCSNSRKIGLPMAKDLSPGKHCSFKYSDVIPIISLFVSDDEGKYYSLINSLPKEMCERFDFSYNNLI